MYDLHGLRVADGPVMTAVTSTNTNAPTIVIAEKGANSRLPKTRAGVILGPTTTPNSGNAG